METVQRIVTRCENEWGAIDAVPNNLSNEEIAAPAAWNALFPVKSFRQSIRGRILKNAIELEMKSPDLRLYKPEF